MYRHDMIFVKVFLGPNYIHPSFWGLSLKTEASSNKILSVETLAEVAGALFDSR